MFAGFLGSLIALPIIIPADFIQTYLRITPLSQLLGWGTLLAAVLALLWWVYRSLTAASVEVAIQTSGLGRARFWHHPYSGFFAGAGLVVLLAIFLPVSSQSDYARKAIERARAQLGPEYRYFVSSLSTSWSSSSDTHVRVTVLAYSDSSVQPVDFEWHE